MKHTTFFFISLFFLSVAFFHGSLYTYFPETFEPVNKFIHEVGPSILYIAGGLAFLIAIFTWLPTWASLVLFIILIFTGGFYLRDRDVSVKIENESFYLTVVKKTVVQSPTIKSDSNSEANNPTPPPVLSPN